MSAAAILRADLERGIVTPEAGSRPVGTEASRVQLAARPPRFGGEGMGAIGGL